ncbi:farnesyl-diphosphate farnesyltransferase [Halobacteriales archaeon QS_8_65_32]|nr:MAG: farnesyl-diphosphate farnesyltransferase [Halobacteriales archaeon QS_8_65_32]
MTDPGPDPRREGNLAWCREAVQGVSRTFAITIDCLEEPMASWICVGYLLCRIPDTVEDAGHIPPAEQVRLLESYGDALDPDSEPSIEEFRTGVDPWLPEPSERNADWAVVAAAPRVVATFEGLDPEAKEAIRPPVDELVSGMARFVDRYAEAGGLRIETIEELEEYCWYAAGTVGTLITNLLATEARPARARTLRANARSFAMLLQLVNVAKDVAADYEEENNVYLPATWLREAGVEQDAITDPRNAPAVARVVRRVARHAEGYLDDTQNYLEALPEVRGNTLAAWSIPYLLAVGTLRELTKRPIDVIRDGGIKVGRAEVGAIVGRFAEGVSRSSLDTIRSQVARGPYQHSGQ